jgi:hypothetical protein
MNIATGLHGVSVRYIPGVTSESRLPRAKAKPEAPAITEAPRPGPKPAGHRVLPADAVTQRRVLLELDETPATTQQIRERMGMTQHRAADALRRLARNGLVSQDWHNRARVWTLTPAGQAEQAAWGDA